MVVSRDDRVLGTCAMVYRKDPVEGLQGEETMGPPHCEVSSHVLRTSGRVVVTLRTCLCRRWIYIVWCPRLKLPCCQLYHSLLW